MPVAIMIIVGVVFFALAIAGIWYALLRGSQAETITEEDFNETYGELVEDGEIDHDDRATAWQEFHAWQLRNEEERRSWEEGSAE
jgi:hypothetical protein